MKNLLLWMLSGALLGIAAASFVVPRALGWYVAPGGLPQGAQVQALVAIPEVVRYSTAKLIYWQWVSAVAGALIGLALSVALRMRARRRRLDASAASKEAAGSVPGSVPAGGAMRGPSGSDPTSSPGGRP